MQQRQTRQPQLNTYMLLPCTDEVTSSRSRSLVGEKHEVLGQIKMSPEHEAAASELEEQLDLIRASARAPKEVRVWGVGEEAGAKALGRIEPWSSIGSLLLRRYDTFLCVHLHEGAYPGRWRVGFWPCTCVASGLFPLDGSAENMLCNGVTMSFVLCMDVHMCSLSSCHPHTLSDSSIMAIP